MYILLTSPFMYVFFHEYGTHLIENGLNSAGFEVKSTFVESSKDRLDLVDWDLKVLLQYLVCMLSFFLLRARFCCFCNYILFRLSNLRRATSPIKMSIISIL